MKEAVQFQTILHRAGRLEVTFKIGIDKNNSKLIFHLYNHGLLLPPQIFDSVCAAKFCVIPLVFIQCQPQQCHLCSDAVSALQSVHGYMPGYPVVTEVLCFVSHSQRPEKIVIFSVYLAIQVHPLISFQESQSPQKLTSE